MPCNTGPCSEGMHGLADCPGEHRAGFQHGWRGSALQKAGVHAQGSDVLFPIDSELSEPGAVSVPVSVLRLMDTVPCTLQTLVTTN